MSRKDAILPPMSAEVKTELQLEIAHILFIDIVGYSKLLMNEQGAVLENLNQVVRNSEAFRAAEGTGKLIRLPTGDGMALVFSDNPEAPVHCALEISRALRQFTQLPVRMGIHSGPISHVVDVNDRENIAGSGINMAQRVMVCGDAGHILLSKRAADDLRDYPLWNRFLKDLGECEVKHGSKLHLVNLCTEELGNPDLPVALKKQLQARKPKSGWLAGRVSSLVLALAAVLLCAFIIRLLFLRERSTESAAIPISDKSIAVLPFENRSDDQENAYFADGVQDEVLTNLSKIADLKVISRTSVLQYRNNVTVSAREVGKALRVANILEGSVQRVGDRVRVNVQLINAKSDTHVWAQRFDRRLEDVFTIESEIAERIVEQLAIRLSSQEKSAIEQRPTTDLKAFEAYVRAGNLMSAVIFNSRAGDKLLEAVQLLDQAVARDPAFFLAYCRLARIHDQMYFFGFDRTPARLALAERAVETARQLQPNAGEAHLTMAAHLYFGYRDYERARAELDRAQDALPNEPFVFELSGFIHRRQGRWTESISDFERALEFDPRNVSTLKQLSASYYNMRRFPEMGAVLDRALRLAPNDNDARIARGLVDLRGYADPKGLHQSIDAILAEQPEAAADLADEWLLVSLCEHNYPEADRALKAMTSNGCQHEAIPFPLAWCEGVAARAKGDVMAAQAAFTKARAQVVEITRQQPSFGEAFCALAAIDAGLGRKQEAIDEGRRAVEMVPLRKDSINGAVLAQYLALIYAWTGEKELAIKQLRYVTQIPGQLDYGDLRLHPNWDSLRGDSEFESLVSSLAPH